MERNRKQLTLFIEPINAPIEKIRAEYNPEQFNLISAHITLCREDEIEPIEKIIEHIKSISLKKPICMYLHPPKRFAEGKGLMIPAFDKNNEFRELRKAILGQTERFKEQLPHITLMHPRNSTCTDELFMEIKKQKLPSKLFFNKITLIEQINEGKWNIINEFNIVQKK
ncbi:MAG: 2'-5' RNA ligase family protein [Gelidibacter sp.]